MSEQPQTPRHAFSYRLTVRPEEIDELNHVHNIQYLRWTNKAAVAHSTLVGWPTARYRESGFGFIVRRTASSTGYRHNSVMRSP